MGGLSVCMLLEGLELGWGVEVGVREEVGDRGE